MDIRYLRKVTFASLMAMFLMATLPFATAHSGDTINAPPLTVPVTIDGVWSAGEWADAPQYVMADPVGGNIGYIRAKYDGTDLLVIMDSPWDTTPASIWPMENTWIAIDKFHDAGGAPKWDDYLFHIGGMSAWQGNGTGWASTWVSFAGMQCSSSWGPGLLPSPNSATPHRIDEMAIPLTHVGSAGSTVGFYALVENETGWGVSAEWPVYAGGWGGWPANTPAPDNWGNLILQLPPPPVGGKSTPITVTTNELALLIGLASLITTVAVSVVYVKRKKKQN